MNKIYKIVNLWMLFVLIFIAGLGASPAQAAPLMNGQEIIQLVNQVRAANGLAPYNVDGALMAAAQSHSLYQASIGSTSHTGEGGSNVTGRALAAGYGGGASVSVTENVYSGMNASAATAVNWWKNDATHLATLISSSYTDAGAGMATADGVVYFTLVVGSVSGAAGSAETQSAALETAPAATQGGSAQAGTAAPVVSSSAASTPGPDGSVVHVVKYGETLWSIVNLYKVNILDVLDLNGLNYNSPIYEGQKIKIKAGGAMPTATTGYFNSEGTPVDPQAQGSGTPRPQLTPSRASALVQLTATAEAKPPLIPKKSSVAVTGAPGGTAEAGAPLAAAPAPGRPFRPFGLDPILALIGAVALVGLGLSIAGTLLNRGE